MVTLQQALRSAAPGTVIQLQSGTYDQAKDSDRCDVDISGAPGRPIIIRGPSASEATGATISGDNLIESYIPAMTPDDPEFSDFVVPPIDASATCCRVRSNSWIVFENVTFKGCRDTAIRIENSHHITLRNASALGGQYVVLATGRRSHHLLVEDVTWQQDESKAMWDRDHWCEFKYGERRKLNGALFASQDIPGDIIIRRNSVSHAFNGIRMDVTDERDMALRGRVNVNVEIYDNEFHFIRDNVVEPEFEATNWWIHDNLIHNAHAWFSFDGLHGGRYYLHYNKSYFDDRPSRRCDRRCQTWEKKDPDRCGDLHDGGRILKFRRPADTPAGMGLPGPIYLFNNSWYTRVSITKKGVIKSLLHWNNAIEFCRSDDPINEACSQSDHGKPFFKDFKPWRAGFDFRFDLSNHKKFPTQLRNEGYGVDGVSITWPGRVFQQPWTNDFKLVSEHGLGAGCRVMIDEAGKLTCDGGATVRPDIGAESRLPRQVFFQRKDLNLYEAPPRIVYSDWPALKNADGTGEIRIAFSVPMKLMSGIRQPIELLWKDGRSARSAPCLLNDRTLTCEVSLEVSREIEVPVKVVLPRGLQGRDGSPVSTWGNATAYVVPAPQN